MPDSGKRFNVGGGSPWSPQEAVRNLMDKFYELTQMMNRAMTSIHHFGNMLANLVGDMGRLKALIAVSVIAGGRMPGRLLSSGLHHAATRTVEDLAGKQGVGGIGGGGKVTVDTLVVNKLIVGSSLGGVSTGVGGGHKGANIGDYGSKMDQAMGSATGKYPEMGTKAGAKQGAALGDTKESIQEEINAARKIIEIHGPESPEGKKAVAAGANARARLIALPPEPPPFVGPPPQSVAQKMSEVSHKAGMGRIPLPIVGEKESLEKKIEEKTRDIHTYGHMSPVGKAAAREREEARARLHEINKPSPAPVQGPLQDMIGGMSYAAADPMGAAMSRSGRGNVVEQEKKSFGQRIKEAGGVGRIALSGAKAIGAVAGGVAGPALAAGAVAHGLMTAASPDLSSTLNMQFQILAGTIGTHLIPTFMRLGMIMQRATGFIEKHGGKIDTAVGLLDRINPLVQVDSMGKKLGLWGDEKGDPSGLLMSIRSMRAQPRYSSIEEAYKNTQIQAISQDPLEAKLQRLVTDNLIKLLEKQGDQLGVLNEVKEAIDRQGIR